MLKIGNGAQIIATDTVPFVIWNIINNPHDYEEALWTTVTVGGDTDTNCAMVGGVVALMPPGIPQEWKQRAESADIFLNQ